MMSELLYWLCAITLALLSPDNADRLQAERAIFGEVEWVDRVDNNESTKGES